MNGKKKRLTVKSRHLRITKWFLERRVASPSVRHKASAAAGHLRGYGCPGSLGGADAARAGRSASARRRKARATEVPAALCRTCQVRFGRHPRWPGPGGRDALRHAKGAPSGQRQCESRPPVPAGPVPPCPVAIWKSPGHREDGIGWTWNAMTTARDKVTGSSAAAMEKSRVARMRQGKTRAAQWAAGEKSRSARWRRRPEAGNSMAAGEESRAARGRRRPEAGGSAAAREKLRAARRRLG